MQRLPDIPGLTDLVRIGQGGNGVVYRANQHQLGRVVAVKVLAVQLDDASAARFAREGHALGIVSGHPNIVPVYTADTTADGMPYLVMLLCENGSLSDRVEQRGPLSVPAVLDLGIRVCGALQTAHDAGLLHRDIKPGNILFDSYDVPRLADFGQAQIADASLTNTGDVVATPGYAAPEVLAGERATARSDVYSLATTLMAALLGHGPFSRETDENIAATLLRVLQEPPPDLRTRGVPVPVAEVLERAMDKTAGRRPISAAELGRRLQDVQRILGLPQTTMSIAGSSTDHPTQVFGAGPATESTRLIDDRPRSGATAPFGAHADQASTTRGRRAKKWTAIAVALLLVAGLATWGVLSLAGARTATNPSDPNDLLVGASDYGPGSWQATEDMQLISDVIGTFPEAPESATSVSPSSLTTCLGLDPETEVEAAKASAQYVDASATKTKDDTTQVVQYRYARSLAFVTKTASDAQRYVTAYASPRFDTCLDELGGLGIDVGKEQAQWNKPAKISVPQHQPDMPDGGYFQARQIEVPLQKRGDSVNTKQDSSGNPQQQGSRYVTVLAMSAGTSAEYVIVQSSSPGVSENMMDAVAAAFVAVATK